MVSVTNYSGWVVHVNDFVRTGLVQSGFEIKSFIFQGQFLHIAIQQGLQVVPDQKETCPCYNGVLLLSGCNNIIVCFFSDDCEVSEQSLKAEVANLKERIHELEEELAMEKNRGQCEYFTCLCCKYLKPTFI